MGCVSLTVDKSMVMYFVPGVLFSVSSLATRLVSMSVSRSISERLSVIDSVSDSEMLSAVVSVAFSELDSVSPFNSISGVCIAVSAGVSVEIVFFSASHPDNNMHRMMNGRYFSLRI